MCMHVLRCRRGSWLIHNGLSLVLSCAHKCMHKCIFRRVGTRKTECTQKIRGNFIYNKLDVCLGESVRGRQNARRRFEETAFIISLIICFVNLNDDQELNSHF